jgi:SNF2 family DNA or RNA helicase
LEVAYTDDERRTHRALQQYTDLRTRAAKTAGEQFAVEFVLKLLKKRLFSSPAAFATTIEKHVAAVGHARGDEGKSGWRRQVEEADDDFSNDEERDETEDAATETASRHTAPLTPAERELLEQLQDYAQHAPGRADSKARKLIAWLKEHIKPTDKWSNHRVIIFTEYRTTQKWLHDLLAAEGLAGNDRLMLIYGGMNLDDRDKIKKAFQAAPEASQVRILLATDAASEGLNLQNHCWQLIHYEIPWNPNRMEQRNGRVAGL